VNELDASDNKKSGVDDVRPQKHAWFSHPLKPSRQGTRRKRASTKAQCSVPSKVALLGKRAQCEVVLRIGAGGDVQIPLQLLAVQHLQLVDRLQRELRVDLRELAVPRAAGGWGVMDTAARRT
jgi:hypothetical protein